ncbi:MAG: pentapeptide repeat-containing protein [Cyanobacteria bacterium P01_F01_bin.56]
MYINHRIRQHDPKFVNLRIIGLAFAALGGTTFSGADLTKASFAHATLKHLNLADSSQRSTILIQVRWHHVQELDRARLGTSNLQDPSVRNLLVTLNGVDHDFIKADLRGVNLAGATLHRINLKGANLNGATLEGAELHGTNLTEAQCVGTDLTGAHLTGACLEAWNIDETTILKDVDCEYVFLKAQPDSRGSRERRPHHPDKVFQPGDFEKFFKEMLDTVQILIRQGIHPQVFKEALAQLMADYDLPEDAVQGFEKKGEDMLVTIAVPTDTDKGQFEQAFDELQALKLEAARTQGLLAGERKRADTLEAILLKPGSTTNTFNVNTTAMNHSNNPNIAASDGSFVNTGDNLQGNVINLGEISGQVSNQINQLPEAAPSADQHSLKALLTELQAAIEAETELSEVEKKEALGEVGKLAEAGTKPQENAMQRMAKRAAANLRSITEPLTEASNLVTVCKSLLPLILAVF